MPVHTTHPSPIGDLLLTRDGAAITGLFLRPDHPVDGARDDGAFDDVRGQLDEYFAATRATFDLALAPEGTAFQQRVWAALLGIPYGRTTTYGALAAQLGSPSASRAVGLANGRNPISVIVPCHRVIGADGSLTGYGGGLERKRALLELESALLPT